MRTMTSTPLPPGDFLTREEDRDREELARLDRQWVADQAMRRRSMQQGMITVVWAMMLVALTLCEMGKWQGW